MFPHPLVREMRAESGIVNLKHLIVVVSVGILVLQGCMGLESKPISRNDEAILTGTERPRTIPKNWKGEPLPDGKGWRWFDPADRGNIVRIYRGVQNAPNRVDRDTYVVVTVKGELIDDQGKPTGEFLRD